MERKKFFWSALASVFVLVFLIFFFTLSGAGSCLAVWVAFVGILLSYAAVVCTPLMVRKSNASADYRRPLFMGSLAYFSASFIFGILVVLVRPEHAKGTFLTYAALFGIYAIFLLINLLSNEHTADQEARREAEMRYVKESTARLEALQEKVKDKTLSKKIEEAYDLISSSPVKSSPAVKAFEDSILQEVSDVLNLDPVTDSVSILQSVDMIISLANKRNSKLKEEN